MNTIEMIAVKKLQRKTDAGLINWNCSPEECSSNQECYKADISIPVKTTATNNEYSLLLLIDGSSTTLFVDGNIFASASHPEYGDDITLIDCLDELEFSIQESFCIETNTFETDIKAW